MKPALIPVSHELQQAWIDYAAAQTKAQSSLRMADGFTAGNLYKRFLDLCVEEERRARVGS